MYGNVFHFKTKLFCNTDKPWEHTKWEKPVTKDHIWSPFKWNMENRHQSREKQKQVSEWRRKVSVYYGCGGWATWGLTANRFGVKRCSDIASDVCTTLWVYENSPKCTLVKVNFIVCELYFNKVTIFKKFAELPEKYQ